MTLIEPAGPLTARMWEDTAEIRARIDALPFLIELGRGTLDPEKFTFYIQQDAQYLVAYQKTMATLAGKAPGADELRFWAKSAVGAVAEEKAMQEELFTNDTLASHRVEGLGMSLHTAAYSNFLLASATYDTYAVAAAAVLPCYWIYAESGVAVLEASKGTLEGHPYGTWVEAYADDSFTSIAREAVRIVEEACDVAGEAERERAVEAFRQATRFEELFWTQPMDEPKDRILI
ncbi:TenA family protein [Dermabacter vaginalis]|uniref:TenA family protein n=1 Tax=Dermabacter vaginalis TaxID=1630135 RepID=UPI0021A5DEF3|nr:TenA family protein [Dermabacter vaginalis]MCT2149381.1 TenA family protein [Dermabacter vaginalis]